MLKARYGDNLVLGLSRRNLELLQAGKPIRFNMRELNLPPADVVIFFGETEEAMMEDLRSHGLAPVADPASELPS
jgi:hypothetical protein